jgi:membrane-associated phospholipid phosphatase
VSFRPVDKVLLGYVAITSGVAAARLPGNHACAWVLLANALVVLLAILVNRPALGPVGRALADLYPLPVMVGCYAALDILAAHGGIAPHDAAVQRWEAAVFGGQPSREWWQRAPSRFLSTMLHAAYLSYYAIVPAGPVWFLLRGERRSLERAVLAVITAYVVCYLAFILFPVAGPYYAFPRPAAWFLDNAPARLVYRLLAGGSSFGAAFPSSHVAAAVAATIAAAAGSRRLGLVLAVPTALLAIAVVYCQMHYAVDAASGLAVGGIVAAGVVGRGRSGQRVEGVASSE